jgi:PERQ amino acid-rich with GYF domain-containing protein
MWGPAPAVNPSKASAATKSVNNGTAANHNQEAEMEEVRSKKKKKKMQKLDASSLLGFTVQADPDRVNVGEIDTGLN